MSSAYLPETKLDLFSVPIFSRTTIGTAIFRSAAFFLAGVVFLIVAYVLSEGWRGLTPGFIFTRAGGSNGEGMFDPEHSGVFDMVVGTVLLVFLMTILVMPVGIITGIFLNEFADSRSWTSRIIRSSINNLAGVPSIIFGLFGLGLFVLTIGGGIDAYILQTKNPVWGKPSLIWAALTLAVLTLPVVVVSTEQALRAVPTSIRDAALGMGATKLQTLWKIVLPQASAGILTGGILAVSRGAGEVAPIMFTGAVYYMKNLPQGLTDPFMELGYHVYNMATQSINIDQVRPLLFSTVTTLLLLTFLLNAVAIFARARVRRRLQNLQHD